MKKIIIFCLVLCLKTLPSWGQVGFMKPYDEDLTKSTLFLDLQIDNDTIILYGIRNDSLGNTGILFLKIDTLGTVLSKSFFANMTIQSGSKEIIKAKDGGYVIVGNILNVGLYILKVNHDLTLDFMNLIESDFKIGGYSLVEVPTGYLILRGQQYPSIIADVTVVKVDKSGNFLWKKSYGDIDFYEICYHVRELSPNEFVLTGYRSNFTASIGDGTPTYINGYIIHIDSLGNQLSEWESPKELSSITRYSILPDSSWICASGTWEYNAQYGIYVVGFFVYRLDKNHNLIWSKKLNYGTQDYILSDIVASKDGNYVVSGFLRHNNAFHYKISPAGDSLWMRLDSAYVDAGLTYPQTAIESSETLSSGSIISIGTAKKNTSIGPIQLGFVMKLSADGCMDTLNCWPVAAYEPVDNKAEILVYPNPAQEVLTIEINQTSSKEFYIYFYDIADRFLRKQALSRGRNELDVGDFPKGMIFYRIENGVGVVGRGKLVKD